jgi:hypothetical protein
MGRYRTAQTWKIIGMFYSDETMETDLEDALNENQTVRSLYTRLALLN